MEKFTKGKLYQRIILAEKKNKRTVVITKITAKTIITFPKKLTSPEGPKKVFTPPPKTAPVLAPLPVCIRIAIINKTQIMV